MAGTGREAIRPRASSITSNQKAQVNVKAMSTNLSGKAPLVVVWVVGVALVVVISLSPFLTETSLVLLSVVFARWNFFL
jgi:hypothetical protein